MTQVGKLVFQPVFTWLGNNHSNVVCSIERSIDWHQIVFNSYIGLQLLYEGEFQVIFENYLSFLMKSCWVHLISKLALNKAYSH